MGTDKDWERWGASDPYFGVVSWEQFRTSKMTSQARGEFFESGEAHIERTLADIRELFGAGPALRNALDFGSGVGRLVIPLARRFEHVIGVDISPSMILEAQRNCSATDVHNATFVLSDDSLSRARGQFDLVHSHIVLQHIPWQRGRKILQAMAGRVTEGGYLAVQLLIGHRGSPMLRSLVRLRYAFAPFNWLRNIYRGRPVFEPAMQLHIYDIDAVRQDLSNLGFQTALVHESQADFESAIIYGQRNAIR